MAIDWQTIAPYATKIAGDFATHMGRQFCGRMEVEDISQELLTAAYRASLRCDPEGNPKSFVFGGIRSRAMSLARSMTRRAKREKVVSLDALAGNLGVEL